MMVESQSHIKKKKINLGIVKKGIPHPQPKKKKKEKVWLGNKHNLVPVSLWDSESQFKPISKPTTFLGRWDVGDNLFPINITIIAVKNDRTPVTWEKASG